MPPAPIVEMHKVSITRDGTSILREIDLRIDRGEKMVILGPNGSGKTSLIKTMTGEFWHDTSVEDAYVKIRGTDHWSLFDVRRAFGIVSGDLQIDFRRDMGTREAVLSGFFGSIGTNRSQEVNGEMEKRADEALALVDSAHLADRVVSTLSMGEARRVLIARALVNDPEALILDEPMSSLDLTGKHLVRQAMRSLAKRGKAIVLVTHDPADIIPEIDRVVMMQDGSIFSDGGLDSMTEESLSALFGVPIRLLQTGGRFCAWS
jgi:iron complex transport system ATP-binding protein